MKIEWNRVTWYSRAVALIVYIGTFAIAFYLGQAYGEASGMIKQVNEQDQRQNQNQLEVLNNASFICKNNKSIEAVFFHGKVQLVLSDGRSMSLPQGISASGARYTNADESFVFWNKGDTAFVQEKDLITFVDCSINLIK